MTREEADFIGGMNMCDEISNEAYKKIMCHCEEQELRWIPISERMPEEDTDVLVTLKCGLIGIMQKKLADDDNGEPCYIWQDFEGEEHEVIAWMPLPKPYKAKSEDKG